MVKNNNKKYMYLIQNIRFTLTYNPTLSLVLSVIYLVKMILPLYEYVALEGQTQQGKAASLLGNRELLTGGATIQSKERLKIAYQESPT